MFFACRTSRTCQSHYLQERRCWNYNHQFPWWPLVGTKQPGAFLPHSPQPWCFKTQSSLGSVCKRPYGCCHAKATTTFDVLSVWQWGAYQWCEILLSSTQRSRSEPNITSEHLTRPPSRASSRALSLFSFGDSKLLGALSEAFFKQGAKTVSMPGEALVDPMQSSPEMDINKPPLHPASPTLHPALIPSYLTLHSPLRFLSAVLLPLSVNNSHAQRHVHAGPRFRQAFHRAFHL